MSEQTQQVFQIQKIYIKNASLESPNTPGIFTHDFQPALEVNLNVESHTLDAENGNYHVLIRVTATTKVKEEVAFLCEVEQAGIFTLQGFSEADLGYLLGVQCPNVLFPYAREAVSDLVTRAGFPQLLLEPVNFEAIYANHLQQKQETSAAQNTQ